MRSQQRTLLAGDIHHEHVRIRSFRLILSVDDELAVFRPDRRDVHAIFRCPLTVSCIGQPPSDATSQRLLRPLRLLTNTIVLPSGDQSGWPTCRVMYSFSIERFFATCALGLEVICLGSVIACGAGKVWV